MPALAHRRNTWAGNALVAMLLSVATAACALPSTPSFESDIRVLCDAGGELGIQEISVKVDEFEITETTPPRRPGGAGVCWYRYELRADAVQDEPAAAAELNRASSRKNEAPALTSAAHPAALVYLEVQTITSRTLDVYEDGRLIMRSGTTRAFANRPVAHRNFVTPATLPDAGAKELLFRVTSGTVAELPLRIWRPEAFHAVVQAEYYALGTFFGVLLIMAGYNFLLGLAIRETAYLYYVFYTFSVGFFLANEDGLVAQWLNLGEGHGAQFFVVSMSLLGLSSMLFARNYLETARFSKSLDRILLGEALLCGALAIIGLTILPLDYLSVVFNTNNFVVIVLAIWAIALGVFHRHRPAQIFALAFFVFIASVLSRTIWLLDLPLASNALFLHGPKIGVALELMILSLGLADRYNRLRDEMVSARIRHSAERERLLGEVHDSIGARLSAALMQMPADTKQSGLRRILESALEYARDLSTLLRQSSDETTFEDEVRGFVRTLDGLPGIQIDFAFDPALNQIEGQRRIDLTRVFQEWISNCVRHGGARRFVIRFQKKSGRIVIGVRSNGLPFAWRGFEDSPGAGSGLRSIVSRGQRLGAGFRSFAGAIGEGSIFVLRVRDDRQNRNLQGDQRTSRTPENYIS
ncbi:MAG: 7TM diverse intracellular signaling domain-containing protein [Leptospirales bacterium]|jgi:signal transduction histidine kinase